MYVSNFRDSGWVILFWYLSWAGFETEFYLVTLFSNNWGQAGTSQGSHLHSSGVRAYNYKEITIDQ